MERSSISMFTEKSSRGVPIQLISQPYDYFDRRYIVAFSTSFVLSAIKIKSLKNTLNLQQMDQNLFDHSVSWR